nr:F-box/LRR-repeat protein 14-like [Rhipicephalus microplus]
MESQSAAEVTDGCRVDVEETPCPSPSRDHAVSTASACTESTETAPSGSQDRYSGEQGIEILNPELIRLIFGYLDVQNRGRMAQVCTAWKAVADEPCIWVNVEARLRLSESCAPVLDCVARRGIRRIKVLSYKEDQVAQLLRALPDIRCLDLSDNYSVNNNVILGAFKDTTYESCTVLNLSWCPQIDDSAIDCLSSRLPNLEELYLVGCDHIADSSMGFIAARLPKLRVLDIKECEVSNAGLQRLAGFGEDGVLSTTLGVKALTHLGLEDCTLVSDCRLGVHQLGLGPAVELGSHLDLSYCNHIDDDAISNISRGSGLVTLTTLNITACPITDVGVSLLAQKLTDLRTLNISECDLVTKDGIAVVASHLHNLRVIHMRYCMGLTNIALKHLSRISSLEVVVLKSCSKIRSKAMAFIAPGKTPSNIVELDGMQKLRVLNLSGCMVGDKGIARIARSLSSLCTLKIARCQEISDNGIKAIACNLKKLKAIDIKGCPRTTSAGRRCLVARLPNLKFL